MATHEPPRRDAEQEECDRWKAEKERIEVGQKNAKKITLCSNCLWRGEKFGEGVKRHAKPNIAEDHNNKSTHGKTEDTVEPQLVSFEPVQTQRCDARTVEPLVNQNQDDKEEEERSNFFEGLAEERSPEEFFGLDPDGREEGVKCHQGEECQDGERLK